MSDYLLGLLSVYGVPVLFSALLIGCAGLPLPSSLLLVAAGAFVEQGDLNGWLVIVSASVGSVVGDNIGFFIGRWGGDRLARRLSRLAGGEGNLAQAQHSLRRWGALGIFLTRWLITPLGGLMNLAAGASDYPWLRFLLIDIAGEVLWVVIYVAVGTIFSDRIQIASDLLGDFTWLAAGGAVALFLGWKSFKYLRRPAAATLLEPALRVKRSTGPL